MLWEYMDLTVLPFFETWSAHIFGGWQRVCWCTNEAFNQASPTKEFWENCPQKKGGHIYGKYAHPLDVKGGIITEKVFPVFSESFFWICFGLVMYISELMGVTEKFAFQMWKNNIDLLGFITVNMPNPILSYTFLP